MSIDDRIRYMGFQPTADGGRQFKFAVKSVSHETSIVVVEIPGAMFAGKDRIMVQEGAGICLAKLRHLYTAAGSDPLPLEVFLAEADIKEYRQARVSTERTPWGTLVRAPEAENTEEDH